MPRFNPKKILVPVDFSKFSLNALRAAVDISRIRDAALTVLHVTEDPSLPDTQGQASVVYANWQAVRNELQQESQKELEAMISEADADQNVKKLFIWGDPANEILRLTDSDNYDLIVMSTHGRTGLSRLLMGSVAEQVIRHAPCPVFVVRGKD